MGTLVLNSHRLYLILSWPLNCLAHLCCVWSNDKLGASNIHSCYKQPVEFSRTDMLMHVSDEGRQVTGDMLMYVSEGGRCSVVFQIADNKSTTNSSQQTISRQQVMQWLALVVK